MTDSLSNLVNNLVQGNVNMDTITKNVKLVDVDTKIATAFLNTQFLKMI